jgi:uracil-DNA glycosylase
MRLLPNVTHVLALGKMAFDAYIEAATQSGADFFGDPVFGHGRSYHATDGVGLYSSYHPSPRNTYTGKLTRKMLVELLERIKKDKKTGGS